MVCDGWLGGGAGCIRFVEDRGPLRGVEPKMRQSPMCVVGVVAVVVVRGSMCVCVCVRASFIPTCVVVCERDGCQADVVHVSEHICSRRQSKSKEAGERERSSTFSRFAYSLFALSKCCTRRLF